jgi:rubredoxin
MATQTTEGDAITSATTAAVTLPAFQDIPDKWRAPVSTQCGKCKKEFEDMKVELVCTQIRLKQF